MEAMLLAVLDSILLFALSIPVVMKYRILPVEETPYWLFGILFLILVTNCLLSFIGNNRYKNWFLVVTLLITMGGATITAMSDRAKTAPVYGVHDIILQQEAAMRKVIEGKNPYKETYFDTPLASFNYDEPGNTEAVNPALYHFVMPPWYLLFPFVFYFTAIPTLGFFDGRMALLFTMALTLGILWFWFRDKALARLAIVLTALSPSVVDYVLEGRSDVFALSWLMGAVYFLGRKNYLWSGLFLGLALMSKQTIWFIMPFYALVVWQQHKKMFWYVFTVVALVVGVLTAPFMLWDTRAFFDSVVLYLTGKSVASYPISGYGLGMMLNEFGFIRDIHAYYPFIYWQIAFALPVLVLLGKWIWKKPSESKLIVSYAIFLTVYWYLSRYFNNSHLGYLSMLFVLGGLKAIDEKST